MIKYSLRLERRCVLQDPHCPGKCGGGGKNGSFTHVDDLILRPAGAKAHRPLEHSFRSRRSYYEYRVVVVGYNGAGASPEAVLDVVTRSEVGTEFRKYF